MTVFDIEIGYDLCINNPLSAVVGPDCFGKSDSVGFGPLAGFALTIPVAAIEVFDSTFDLAFGTEEFDIFA